MRKLIILILIIVVAVGLLTFVFKNNDQSSTAKISNGSMPENQDTNTIVNEDGLMSEAETGAVKIEVVHFHGTHQCWSCITVGEYALKTIKEKFPEEYSNGTIVFKDINSELAENGDIVMKYQARGSSLFINAIKDGVDNIQEDATVWRLVTNESQYINYLQNKISGLLVK